ncbi:MAG: hypothetical protein WCX90_01690 [Thiohalomonadaceae bacterium]
MNDKQKKTAIELLAELNRVRRLLAEQNASIQDNDIPLLDDIVGDKSITHTQPAITPAPVPTLPTEIELEAMLDKIIDREMPRIRLELKRVLRDELRMRELLK